MKSVLQSFLVVLPGLVAGATDLATLCADRAALERVYHEHRTGTKLRFEEAMPRALLERLVRDEERKEATLRKIYAVEITPAMVEAEVQRIDTTTRAPEMLAEIKAALGNDPARFARTMARPILVERELRYRFDNDDKLHAEKRREAEQARATLLSGKTVGGMQEVTWQLAPRTEEETAKLAERNPAATPATKGTAKSTSYSVEATAQVSQVVATPEGAGREPEKHHFEDLDPQLQNVLRVQLQKPGDVSAVIEMPAGFVIFQAKERSATELSASSHSIPKRGYEEWLAKQPDGTP
jgi:hypothetical protein